MKWRRNPGVYPVTYESTDGRFQMVHTYTRSGLRTTYSRVQLVDRRTGEEFGGFRSLREARRRARSQ